MAMAPPRKKRLCRYGGSARRGAAQPPAAGENEEDSWLRSEQCYFEASGWCKYGDECHFRHTGAGKARGSREGGGAANSNVEEAAWDGANANAEQDDWRAEQKLGPCPLYQLGCCWFDRTCYYSHVKATKEDNLRLTLCPDYVRLGTCSNKDCMGAHSQAELDTPSVYEGMPGYKACLCTFHLAEGTECTDDLCFNAHGELELRRLPLAVPRSLASHAFAYSDAHVHLDHVLLSRKYGTYWFYKHQSCKRVAECGFRSDCMFVHDDSERQPRPLEFADLESLAKEIRALPGEFQGCVHSCCGSEDIETAVQLVRWGREVLGGRVYASFGVHPTNFEDFTPELEAKLKAALDECGPQGIAWGECGLDYYRRAKDIEEDPETRTRMKAVFAKQAHIAVRRGLPLVIHSRDAEADTLEVLRQVVPPTHPVHLHSFMGSVEMMQELLRRYPKACVGVAGAVTYDVGQYAGGLGDIVRALPLDRLLLETDGPYMAPNPYRGEESHPGQIPWIADGVAQVKGVSAAEVVAAAHANFRRLYSV